MRLSQIANTPRRIDLGGAFFVVSALTQYEWAEFQGWMYDNVPRPETPEGADAIERALHRKAWPPSIASKEWFAALDHPGCFAAFVQVVIGKHAGREVTDEEALALAVAAVEYGKVADLVMYALGGDPIDPAAAPPAGPEDRARRPEGDDPGDVYFQFAKGLAGWSHDDIMRLTFPQIRYYRHAGKPPEMGSRRFTSVADARGVKPGGPPVDKPAAEPPGCMPATEPPKYPEPEVQIFGDYRGPT